MGITDFHMCKQQQIREGTGRSHSSSGKKKKSNIPRNKYHKKHARATYKHFKMFCNDRKKD